MGVNIHALHRREDVFEDQPYDSGVTAFVILCTCLVLTMVPGLGFLYSGLARRKSALSMIWACLMGAVVSIFTWYFWAYSLSFSDTATNGFIGNLDYFGLKDMDRDGPETELPTLLFAAYQGMFLCVTIAIIMGAVAERGRLFPAMIFCALFATIVYAPLACWVWNSSGWAYKWEVLDYAGGGPVEIGSGFGALAYSFVLGRRKEQYLLNFRPHNVSMVTLGTALLWFGWLGFNGGTALAPNLKAVYAIWNSNLTAVFGAMTWCLLDYRLERKWSTVAVCSGIISGLVAATPASGCIPLWASVILGVVASVVCNFSTKIKYMIKIDDSMDVLAEHGIAGVVGLIFNALFGADYIVGSDGATAHGGGWVSHNWKQLYKQIAYIAAGIGYTFVVSVILCYAIDRIPGCKLRASEEAEIRGMDEDQIGEFAYDYVEVRRDFFSDMSGIAAPAPAAPAAPAPVEDSTSTEKES